MKKIKVIAKHSRPLNLLVIALLQVMLYFFVIYLPYQDLDLPWRLSPLDLSLIGIDLLIITAAGYLINDIFDRQTDALHPQKKSIDSYEYSPVLFQTSYWILVSLGAVLTLILAWKFQEWALSLLYPAGTYLLYLYAQRLKSTILWGNILIALLCLFPVCLMFLGEKPAILALQQLYPDQYYKLYLVISFYCIFSFLATFIREIIKDQEDREADQQAGVTTIATAFPINQVKRIVAISMVVFTALLILCSTLLFFNSNTLGGVYLILIPTPLTIYSGYLYKGSTESNDFRKLSHLYKLIILTGIIALVFM